MNEENEAKLEHKLTAQEQKAQKSTTYWRITRGLGYVVYIVGLIVDKASPLVAAILAFVGFLIARIGGIFKKQKTLEIIKSTQQRADTLQYAMDLEDKRKPPNERRSAKLRIVPAAGPPPIGTENAQCSYLFVLFLSTAVQILSTIFSSYTIKKGKEFSLGMLTPDAFQYLTIALSIVAIILPDALNYFEEKNQERKLTAYQWRLTTLEVINRLEPRQVEQLRQDIDEGLQEPPPVLSPPVLSLLQPPAGVSGAGDISHPSAGRDPSSQPQVVVASLNPQAPLSAPSRTTAFMPPPLPGQVSSEQTSSTAAPQEIELPNVPKKSD